MTVGGATAADAQGALSQFQCALFQFGPTPTSANNGTLNCATPAISRGTSARTQSTSASGTSNTSTEGVDLVPHVAKKRRVRAALNNSFGFGGTNASVIVKAIED